MLMNRSTLAALVLLLGVSNCEYVVKKSSLRPSKVMVESPSFVHSSGKSYVLTPAGWLLEECVTVNVPSGSVVEPLDGGHTRVSLASGEHYVTLPPCTKEAPPRLTVRILDDTKPDSPVRSTKNVAALPPYYDGWQAYTQYQHPADITSFLGSFSVPDIPSQTPMVDYIFTGLQNIGWVPIVDPEPDHINTPFDIIQPVLQYPGMGGNYWSARSWIVSLGGIGGQTFASTEIPLTVGDYVFGNMTRTGPQSWDVISVSRKTGASTTLHTKKNSRLSSQPFAYVTLETYGAPSCGYYPTKPSSFINMTLSDADGYFPAQWDAIVTPAKLLKCPTLRCQVQSPYDVQILFT